MGRDKRIWIIFSPWLIYPFLVPAFSVDLSRKVLTPAQLLHNIKTGTFSGSNITLRCFHCPVNRVIKILSEKGGLPIQPAGKFDDFITIELVDLPWDKALAMVIRAKNLKLSLGQGILTIHGAEKAVDTTGAKKGDFIFFNADLKRVLIFFARVLKLNLVLDPDIQGRVTLRLIDVHWQAALNIILRQHKLALINYEHSTVIK